MIKFHPKKEKDIEKETQTHVFTTEFNSVLAKPTLLDPRFKRKAFASEDAFKTAKDRLLDEMVALIRNRQRETDTTTSEVNDDSVLPSSENLNSVWQDFDALVKSSVAIVSPTASAITEMRMYLEDSLLWWKTKI